MKLKIIYSLLILLLVTPLVIFSRDKYKDSRFIVLFYLFTFIQELIGSLPINYPALQLFDTTKNWFGKLYSLIFVLTIYVFVRKKIKDYDFFTLKQEPGSLKKTLPLLFIPLIITIIVTSLSGSSDFNWLTAIFNITLPGIEEEMVFRGIMMSFLLLSLKDNITIGRLNLGNPAILITAIIFGLNHSLTLHNDFSITHLWSVLLDTGFAGYIWAYAALKNRSLLLPIIFHNVGNFVGYLIGVFQ